MSIDVSGVIMDPTIIELLSISPFMSFNIYVVNLYGSLLCTYMFMNVMNSSYIDPFIII